MFIVLYRCSADLLAAKACGKPRDSDHKTKTGKLVKQIHCPKQCVCLPSGKTQSTCRSDSRDRNAKSIPCR